MATMIRPNRLEVSDRFPVAGFTVKTGNYPWFEVALATEPGLFRAERKSQRTHSNFYSSHAMGPLPAERGEAVYLVPPEVLKRFAGQPKLYFGLATFPDANRSRAEVLQAPSEGSPWLNLKLFTGRGSRRMMALPHPRNGHARNGNGYMATNPEELTWSGDAAQPGTEAIATSPPANGSTTAPASPTPSSPSTPPNTSASAALGYDDGFDPSLWAKPQRFYSDRKTGAVARPFEIVNPIYNPSNTQDALRFMQEWQGRQQRWRAGVSDTTFFPHSAICQFRIALTDGRAGIGTGFYIAPNRILTCAHNVDGASSITIIPGKNGNNEPFGSFTVGSSAWAVHPNYNGTRDFDLAVIMVDTPPPNGWYFDILEELLMSYPSPIIVCGYAA
ncbi:MAG: trypsin-like serine peptidase, partial [bacterium]